MDAVSNRPTSTAPTRSVDDGEVGSKKCGLNRYRLPAKEMNSRKLASLAASSWCTFSPISVLASWTLKSITMAFNSLGGPILYVFNQRINKYELSIAILNQGRADFQFDFHRFANATQVLLCKEKWKSNRRATRYFRHCWNMKRLESTSCTWSDTWRQ